jgi:hypothetical protein
MIVCERISPYKNLQGKKDEVCTESFLKDIFYTFVFHWHGKSVQWSMALGGD